MKKLTKLKFTYAFMSLVDTVCNSVDAIEEERKEESEVEKKYSKLITALTIIIAVVGVVRTIDLGNKIYKLDCKNTETETEE